VTKHSRELIQRLEGDWCDALCRKDTEKLRNFIAILPKEQPVAFEFRHESWVDDEVTSILRDRDAAIADYDRAIKSGPKKIENLLGRGLEEVAHQFELDGVDVGHRNAIMHALTARGEGEVALPRAPA